MFTFIHYTGMYVEINLHLFSRFTDLFTHVCRNVCVCVRAHTYAICSLEKYVTKHNLI